jgi:ribosomal protein S18 acetylase RimI-like enzyme
MHIRPAGIPEAAAIAAMIARAIREAGGADHFSQPGAIAAWVGPKSATHVEAWLSTPGAVGYVAIETEHIIGFGHADKSGFIHNLYVSPDAQGRGVGAALLARLEDDLIGLRLSAARLEASVTAQRFYEKRGYRVIDNLPSRNGLAPTCVLERRLAEGE